ncbi:MAG: diacylglycerol kinase family lipid kinase [Clostridia bacterium]|nr:diacylglycerol kinase family lipid kinase [Clostridia bacterium]
MRKILFIINPVAGKGITKEMIPEIKRNFKDDVVDIKITKNVGDATQIAKTYSESYSDIISVGGDGTLTEIVDGLKDYKGKLGIIPAGTGNDFARSLNIEHSLFTCLEIIKNGKTKKCDILKVNDHRFINVASFGIDGQVIIETDKIKHKIKGTTAYVISSLKAIRKFEPYKVKLSIDGKTLEREIVLVAVGNGQYFGGGMQVTPRAKIDDGQLDVVLANKTSKINLIKLFLKLFKGEHIGDALVEHYKCLEFKIESHEDLYINADGNLIGKVPASISVENEKIQVIIP